MQEKNKAVAAAETKVEESQVGQWDALARNMVRLFDEGTKVLGTLVERRNGSGPYSMASEAGEATKALGEVARQLVSEPGKLAAAQSELFKDYAELWGRSVRRFLGEEDDVFEFNAWDHVETDDAFKEYAEQQFEMQRQSPVSDFDKSKFQILVLVLFLLAS